MSPEDAKGLLSKHMMAEGPLQAPEWRLSDLAAVKTELACDQGRNGAQSNVRSCRSLLQEPIYVVDLGQLHVVLQPVMTDMNDFFPFCSRRAPGRPPEASSLKPILPLHVFGAMVQCDQCLDFFFKEVGGSI